MKTEITSLELHYITNELQQLIGAKVEQIYGIGTEEMIIQFHVPGKGKKILRIIIGSLMYLASTKTGVPEKPPGFCLYLRKKLKNARLRVLTQLGFERIIECLFETKDFKFKLIIELFGKGNIILCNEEGIIQSALFRQHWKDRAVKSKEEYKYPKKEFNFLKLTMPNLVDVLTKSEKENLVKTLAIDLGLGGVYAEELCALAGIDKNISAKQLSDNEVVELFKSMQEVSSKEISARVVYKDEEKKELKNIVPFALKVYEKFFDTEEKNFNAALDSVLTTKLEEKEIASAHSTAKTKLDKINDMLSKQKIRIDGLKESEVKNQRIGEIIYENYALVNQMISELMEMKKNMSWKEIKARLKNSKLVHNVNEKTCEVSVDIGE